MWKIARRKDPANQCSQKSGLDHHSNRSFSLEHSAAKQQISWVVSLWQSLLFDQGFPNNTWLQRHLANRNAIWQYFVSMRLYLAMLFILSITNWWKNPPFLLFFWFHLAFSCMRKVESTKVCPVNSRFPIHCVGFEVKLWKITEQVLNQVNWMLVIRSFTVDIYRH